MRPQTAQQLCIKPHVFLVVFCFGKLESPEAHHSCQFTLERVPPYPAQHSMILCPNFTQDFLLLVSFLRKANKVDFLKDSHLKLCTDQLEVSEYPAGRSLFTFKYVKFLAFLTFHNVKLKSPIPAPSELQTLKRNCRDEGVSGPESNQTVS